MAKKSSDPELERFTERKQLSWDSMFYSIQRLDLLIISISGAGIYACLEMCKFLIEKKFCFYTVGNFKLPAIIFIITIIANLISQYTGYLSNKYEYLMCNEQIDCHGKEKEDIVQKKIDKYDKKSDSFNKATDYLNFSSLILLVLGLALLIYYYALITFL